MLESSHLGKIIDVQLDIHLACSTMKWVMRKSKIHAADEKRRKQDVSKHGKGKRTTSKLTNESGTASNNDASLRGLAVTVA